MHRLLVGGLALVFSLTAQGARPVEAFGDSVTAGFLSHTDLTQPPGLKPVSRILTDMARFLITSKPSYLAPHHAPEQAWPQHLAEHLRAAGERVTVQNYAVSGAHSWHLAEQVTSAGGPPRSTLGLFFIGNNDLCENQEPIDVLTARFKAQYSEALRRWDEGRVNGRALIMPIPYISRVFKSLKGVVWFQSPNARYRCEDCWTKLFPYCPSYARMEKAGTLAGFLDPRVDAMNVALEELTTEWNRRSKDNVFIYLKDIHDVPFESRYFSIDCYHLSAVGQKSLGDEAARLGL